MELEFSKYERARIIGARALQIAMNAPLLLKISQEDLEQIKFDALKIAEIELNSGVLPISISRPFPDKKEEKLKRIKEKVIDDQKVQDKEIKEEEEIAKEGEIMELASEDGAETENEAEEEGGSDFD